jgi:LmbE family N-acetylglucosaminyl deacetylase
MLKVSCIIPAHNESATVGSVVRAARACRQIGEIIVVSDGSTDQTARVASEAGADRVLVLRRNLGKGGAIQAGVQASSGDVVLLLDADLCGVTAGHLTQLLWPVLAGRTDMGVAVFTDNIWHGVMRPLSGQRAVRRSLLLAPHLAKTGFGFEIALDRLAKTYAVRTAHVSWAGVSHRLKRRKYGMMRGMRVSLRASSDLVRQVRVRRPRHAIVPPRAIGQRRRTRMEALLLALIVFAVIVRPLFFAHPSQAAAFDLPAMAPPGPEDRVLVVVAHPDDEVIGAGGLIAAARRRGVSVSALIVTNGDSNRVSAVLVDHRLPPRASAFIREGRIRQQEELEALRRLGVAPADVFFLGFPDRQLAAVMRSPFEPVRSPFTHLETAEYDGVLDPGATYTRTALVDLARTVVDLVHPTLIITHSSLDRHSDHIAVAQLVDLVRDSTPVYSFVVHAPGFPRPLRSSPNDPLLPPPTLTLPPQWSWMRYALSPEDERTKRHAMSAHRSQLATPYLRLLLVSFVRTNEVFAVHAADALAAPGR